MGFREISETRCGTALGDDGPAPGDERAIEPTLRGESLRSREDLNEELAGTSSDQPLEFEGGSEDFCLSLRRNSGLVDVFGLSGMSSELRIGLGGHVGLPIDRGAVDGPSGGGEDALVG